MKNIYQQLAMAMSRRQDCCLATLVNTRGSVPQVPGASALIGMEGLLAGTLGGGILEGDATRKAMEALRSQTSHLYEHDLNAGIDSREAAICGGYATVLLDADPFRSREAFRQLDTSLQKGIPGVLFTRIKGREHAVIERSWSENGHVREDTEQKLFRREMKQCLSRRNCVTLETDADTMAFLEPVLPVPKLYIAGAGHIGRALVHLANLLEFEVTVIDDRAEYANERNIPDADHHIAGDIGIAMEAIPASKDVYVVIVTRGHQDDAKALKACIRKHPGYIGMIGSSRKIKLMRDKFLGGGLCSEAEFDRVCAPVGLEIGSKTVQEIALSIAAQLVQHRNLRNSPRSGPAVAAIVLAAGASKRMGRPKMLLPYKDSTIIETVIENVMRAGMDQIHVVLGTHADAIARKIEKLPVQPVLNPDPGQGMLSSVQRGLEALSPETEAVMILLGDQPMIETGIIDQMIDDYRHSSKDIMVASYRGKRGHPLMFGKKYFGEVLSMTDRHTLKDLINRHPDELEEMNTGDPEVLQDIDTEKDYQEALRNTT